MVFVVLGGQQESSIGGGFCVGLSLVGGIEGVYIVCFVVVCWAVGRGGFVC